MPSNSLDTAIAEGIDEGKKAQLTKKARKNKKIAARFNKASGLLDALEAFHVKHPEVTFKVEKTLYRMTISTNILLYVDTEQFTDSVSHYSRFAAIEVSPRGRITALGEERECWGGQRKEVRTKVSKPDANERIVSFVAKHAAKKGLIS